ncbi:hypothetical protein Btru_063953 [Bulinus truncatus]|nr:hypothetical protein Btru_063953 [Bulinus truncatus]
MVLCGETKTLVLGGESKTLVLCGETKTLVFGGGTKTLVLGGETKTLVLGGETKTLVFGGGTNTLVLCGETKTLVLGGATKTLVLCGETKTLVLGGATKTLVLGGETMTLVFGGGTKTLVLGGETKTLVLGGETMTLVFGGGTKTLVLGGETKTLVLGGETKTMVLCGETKTMVLCGETKTMVFGGGTKTLVLGGETMTLVLGEIKTLVLCGETMTLVFGEIKALVLCGETKTLVLGLEPTETNPFLQLEHILTRIKNAQDVIKYIRDDAMKQHINFRRRHKEHEGEVIKTESFSTTSMETFLSEFNNKMATLPLNSNVNYAGAGIRQMTVKEEIKNVETQQTMSATHIDERRMVFIKIQLIKNNFKIAKTNCKINDTATVFCDHKMNENFKSKVTKDWKKSNIEILKIKMDGLQTSVDLLRQSRDSPEAVQPFKKNKMADIEPVALNVYKRLKSAKDHVSKPATDKNGQHAATVASLKLQDRLAGHDSDLHNIVGDSCPADCIGHITSVGQMNIRSKSNDYTK